MIFAAVRHVYISKLTRKLFTSFLSQQWICTDSRLKDEDRRAETPACSTNDLITCRNNESYPGELPGDEVWIIWVEARQKRQHQILIRATQRDQSLLIGAGLQEAANNRNRWNRKNLHLKAWLCPCVRRWAAAHVPDEFMVSSLTE